MAQLENFRLKVFRSVAEHLNVPQSQLPLRSGNTTEAIKSAVEAGLGVGFVSHSAEFSKILIVNYS